MGGVRLPRFPASSPIVLPFPAKIHSMLFLETRDSQSRTSAPISLLPCSCLDNCRWLTPSSAGQRRAIYWCPSPLTTHSMLLWN